MAFDNENAAFHAGDGNILTGRHRFWKAQQNEIDLGQNWPLNGWDMVNLLELLKMTVSELRELARKHVGRSHRRLKTKGELISALKKIVAAQKTASAKPKKRSKAKPRSKRAPRVGTKRAASASAPSADIVASRLQAEPPRTSSIRRPAPLSEGFFTGAKPPAPLPPSYASRSTQPTVDVGYGTDQVVALSREPRTLFVFWDLAPRTLRAASEGLLEWRLVLRVCAGERVLREHPVDLEHGRAYLEDIPLARGARVELHLVDANTSRRVAASEIPESFEAEQDSSLRLAEIPWELPLMELPKATQAGRVRVRRETTDLEQTVRSRVAALDRGSSPVAAWGGAPGQGFALPSSR